MRISVLAGAPIADDNGIELLIEPHARLEDRLKADAANVLCGFDSVADSPTDASSLGAAHGVRARFRASRRLDDNWKLQLISGKRSLQLVARRSGLRIGHTYWSADLGEGRLVGQRLECLADVRKGGHRNVNRGEPRQRDIVRGEYNVVAVVGDQACQSLLEGAAGSTGFGEHVITVCIARTGGGASRKPPGVVAPHPDIEIRAPTERSAGSK